MTSGILNYADIENIVETIIKIEVRKNIIPGLSEEDIAQEIRLECFKVVSSYDDSRIGPSPFKFLQVCVKNALYNMKRGIWVPNNPPCVRCPLWNKKTKACDIEEFGCVAIQKYKENMSKKAALKKPAILDDGHLDNYSENKLDAILLDLSIRSKLSPDLIPFYDKLLNGSDKVPVNIQKKIQNIVLDITNES